MQAYTICDEFVNGYIGGHPARLIVSRHVPKLPELTREPFVDDRFEAQGGRYRGCMTCGHPPVSRRDRRAAILRKAFPVNAPVKGRKTRKARVAR